MSSSDALTSSRAAGRGASRVEWRPWSRHAFDEAGRSRKPVLLSITAHWCRGCTIMDSTCYADAGIAATINRRFVPIRVDADRRPDIHDRYNLEGLPTTACLTPSGELLAGSTYLPPERLVSMLLEAADGYAERADELEERAAAAAAARRDRAPRPLASAPDLSAPDWFAELAVRECDRQFGGFGAGGRFLQIDALRVALRLVRSGRRPELAEAVRRTLDGMAEGAIHDRVEGGFFRYASARDWSKPRTEKLLSDQAGIASVYMEAADVLQRSDWMDVARRTIAFVSDALADRERGGFRASLAGDDDYYALGADARRERPRPDIDDTIFTDWNAAASRAFLQAAQAFPSPDLEREASRALDRVMSSFAGGDGVAHWADDPDAARGLLMDQVQAAAALLAHHEVNGRPGALEQALDLMRTAIRTLWDEHTGGFKDRRSAPDDVGLMRDPLRPLAANGDAARVLARLSTLTGDPDLQQRAIAVLQAQSSSYRRHGLAAAPYVAAVIDLLG